MAAEIGEVADRLEVLTAGCSRFLGVNKESARQALEAAEDLQHIFAVVGDGHRLAIGAKVPELRLRLPRFRVKDVGMAGGRIFFENGDEDVVAIIGEAKV